MSLKPKDEILIGIMKQLASLGTEDQFWIVNMLFNMANQGSLPTPVIQQERAPSRSDIEETAHESESAVVRAIVGAPKLWQKALLCLSVITVGENNRRASAAEINEWMMYAVKREINVSNMMGVAKNHGFVRENQLSRFRYEYWLTQAGLDEADKLLEPYIPMKAQHAEAK